MRRVDESDEEMPGGDSFLDITANIVGILVLLVVVVGVRAGRHVFFPDAPVADAEPLDSLQARLNDQVRQVRAEQSDILALRDKVLAAEDEALRRDAMRQSGVLYVTKLRAELDEARESLDKGDQRSLTTHNEIAQAKLTLDRLTREQIALASVEPAPDAEPVEVAPTPIVDGKADQTISFRLQKGRLVYVPVNEIELELAKKIEIPAITDPTRSVVTHETLGPVEGFVGEAEIGWSVRAAGSRIGIRPQLGKLLLREVTPLRGESPDEAFGPGGYVGSRLELLEAEKVVVRLIVYADSFDKAPEVGKRFRERGFRVAQSLKANGALIGFSSDGHQAVTQ
ncbi:hypothetical protein Pla108_19790 [Botrimarina colliarenosi]|uniref:Uncharacterized protein n=1 Tax=Botrimarina colliarenosi TaxID=2528001 RepID=A0A5C6AEI3_9BACT|nr:hypothetical protein [Botrimarina colliarenosi]TWT97827.1 hypothetical protein Pla108_19790 [Botrimarina colliarenosi]